MRILGFTAVLLAASVLFSGCSVAAMTVYHAHAKSGVPTRVHEFHNCATHVSAQVNRGYFVEHGKVEVRASTGDFCGHPNEPIYVLWFTSDPGFKGTAEINFPRPSQLGNNGRVIEIEVN